jgi:NAD(P)-dependent dehydrogenase (short-subunit alcohol dehydrogenase family)
MMNYIVIGASRGLGARLVEELLNAGCAVWGIGRSHPEDLPQLQAWSQTGRFTYRQLDIAESECRTPLRDLARTLPAAPLGVIFNAAQVVSDYQSDGTIDWQRFHEVNRVQIDGFGHVLEAFQEHLKTHGGSLIGISSFGAYAPPVADPRLAYPASKAYLDMALRSLRLTWKNRPPVVTVHLGCLGERSPGGISAMFFATYSQAARHVVAEITGLKVPDEINYPFFYTLVYKYALSLVPDRLYGCIFGRLLK